MADPTKCGCCNKLFEKGDDPNTECADCKKMFCVACAKKLITTTCCEKQVCCFVNVEADESGVISVWSKGEKTVNDVVAGVESNSHQTTEEIGHARDLKQKKKASHDKTASAKGLQEGQQEGIRKVLFCNNCNGIVCDMCDDESVHGKMICGKCGRRFCCGDNCTGFAWCSGCEKLFCEQDCGCSALTKCRHYGATCGQNCCSECWMEQGPSHCDICPDDEAYPICQKHLYKCNCQKHCPNCAEAVSLRCESCGENLRSECLPTLSDDSDASFCEIMPSVHKQNN